MLFCNLWNIIDLHKVKIHHYVFFTVILHFFIFSCNAQLSFNYSTLDPNIKEIVYYGDAAPFDNAVQLTANYIDETMYNSTGRVKYSEPMDLWDKESGWVADFSTNFSFTIDSKGYAKHADGITIFIAPVDFAMGSVQYESGGLGLASGENKLNSTLNQFVAVEFDTYQNPWDPAYCHVGININSMKSVKTARWNSSIPEGHLHEAWINYNSSANNLTVLFTSSYANQSSIKSLSYEVDLSKYLPEKVIFGFSAATRQLFWETHAIHMWNLTSSIHPGTLMPKKKISKKLIVGLGLGATACILVTWLASLWFKSKKKWKTVNYMEKDVTMGSYEIGKETGPRKYSYETLSTATKNFAESLKVGQGGFGGVYKGFLSQLDSYVAIKRIEKGSKQGIKEYASEVKIISRVRHRNLVQLIGWCHEEKELLLVYEFMTNGSLDTHLFKDNMFLTWITRYNIARGLASALLYLHEEWEQCVLHRDIKTSNIILDSKFNAKLGDFGLARLVDHGKEIETTVLAGTMGYMAPEYVLTSKASKESDVYSFGIVALEIASGRRAVNPKAKQGEVLLVEFVWELYGQGKILEAADHKLSATSDEKQLTCLMIVGLWCAHPDYKLRPSIKQAIQVLDFEAPLPCLASKMPMLNHLSTSTSTCSSSRTGSSSVRDMPSHSSNSIDNVILQ